MLLHHDTKVGKGSRNMCSCRYGGEDVCVHDCDDITG